MILLSLLLVVFVVLCGPFLGLLLGKIAAEEIASARKYLVSLIWFFGVIGVSLIFFLWLDFQLIFLLAVDFLLIGLCTGVLLYDRWWG